MNQPRVVPGGLLDVPGFRAMGVAAGIKKKRRDVSVIFSMRPDTAAACVFTTNLVQAAPVLVTKRHVANGRARAIVTNAGCANAATGEQGLRDAEEMAAITAKCLAIQADEVLVASTGVIGRHLPMDLVREGVKNAVGTLDKAQGGEVAEAMMTTDTIPKEVLVEATVAGVPIKVAGVAKGSGMIHPNMATMLSWIVTDCAVAPAALQRAVRDVADRTFNMISVDGDTSTNDMMAVLANGAAANHPVEAGHAYTEFVAALETAALHLAKMIARDGEGATTLLEVRVENARTVEDARKAARAVGSSMLVKSAVFGRDPNWGRILAAAGRSGAQFDPSKVDVQLASASGRAWVLRAGEPCETLGRESLVRIVDRDHVTFIVDFHDGAHSATAWGCDLSYDYVKINAEYTT